jgi:MFS family permease
LPLALVGWLSSLVLWLRFGNIERFHKTKPANFTATLPQAWRFFIPATLIAFLRGLIITSLGTYLPTFLSQGGANMWAAGSALALYQFAGAIGALAGGTLSDHLGRRRVLALTMFASSILLLGFLATSGWLSFAILLLIGVMNLTFQPIMLALVQDHYPHHRSVANGIYMTLSFISFSANAVLVGAVGDWVGLQNAFLLTGLLSLLAIPLLMALPKPQTD